MVLYESFKLIVLRFKLKDATYSFLIVTIGHGCY